MRKKLYYPASHIINGLYTTGKEWMSETGTEYVGYYHTYIDGTVLTEAVYNTAKSVKLIPYINKIDQPDSRLYNSITTVKDVYKSPVYHFPIPSLEDYNKGYFLRYFVRKRNYASYVDIIEIDETEYSTLNTPNTGIDGNLYLGISLRWKLTGPLFDIGTGHNIVYGVSDTNKRIVELKDKDLRGLKQFLTDYTELTIYSQYVSSDIKKTFGN